MIGAAQWMDNPKSVATKGAAFVICIILGWQLVVTAVPQLEIAAGQPGSALAFDDGDPAAHDALAASALDANHLAEAHEQAIKALSAEPIDQSALTIAAVSGSALRQSSLLALSAGLGWRDLATQALLARQGIQQGNAELFAQRLDAYQRQAGGTGSLLPLLDRYIGNPSVQAAIVPRLAADPDWRSPYLRGLPNPDPDLIKAREAVLAMLVHSHAPPRRHELEAFVFALMTNKLDAEAYAVWRNFIADPKAWSGLLYDGDFEHISDDDLPLPYEWTIRDTSGAYATVELGDRLSQLHVHSEGVADGPLAGQSVAMASGHYRLSVQATRQDGAGSVSQSDFLISVRCGQDDERIEGNSGEGGSLHVGINEFGFDVPSGCGEPLVTIGTQPGSAGVPDDLWLTHARIDRVL